MSDHLRYSGIRQSLAGIQVSLRRVDGGNYSVKAMGAHDDSAIETDCLHTAYVAGIKMQPRGRAHV